MRHNLIASFSLIRLTKQRAQAVKVSLHSWRIFTEGQHNDRSDSTSLCRMELLPVLVCWHSSKSLLYSSQNSPLSKPPSPTLANSYLMEFQNDIRRVFRNTRGRGAESDRGSQLTVEYKYEASILLAGFIDVRISVGNAE